jgi:hypothetical protein
MRQQPSNPLVHTLVPKAVFNGQRLRPQTVVVEIGATRANVWLFQSREQFQVVSVYDCRVCRTSFSPGDIVQFNNRTNLPQRNALNLARLLRLHAESFAPFNLPSNTTDSTDSEQVGGSKLIAAAAAGDVTARN